MPYTHTYMYTKICSVISNAIRSILSASHRQLEYRVQVVQWKDGDEDFVPDYGRDWATIITIPSFFGNAVLRPRKI